jgi:integrase
MKTPSIHEAAERMLQVMEENCYSNAVLHDAHFILAQIVQLHETAGLEAVDSEIIRRFANEKRKCFEAGKFGRSMLNIYLSFAKRLENFIVTGSIAVQRPLVGDDLAEYYKSILLEVRATRFGANSVQPQVVSCAYQYFNWLLKNGCQDLSTVTHETLRQYMLSLTKRLNGNSLRRSQRNLKLLSRFFLSKGYAFNAFDKILSMPIAVEKKVLPAMDINEFSQIVNCINRETAMGKRRYAIMLLGAVTGLRACDIAALRFSEIDWRTGTIRIIQSKTDNPLILPLTSDVGNAIKDYILNGRPKVHSERIFLNAIAPYNDISSSTVITTVADCKETAGLSPYGGFHSLRRAVGRNMSIAGIPVTTIAQILGHTRLNSTKQYISLDSFHLKACALDFAGIEPRNVCLDHERLKSCALDFANIYPAKEICIYE